MIVLSILSGSNLTLFLAAVFGMFILSVALVVFFVVYQRRIFAQLQQRERAEQSHQKELLEAAVAVQEIERRRIAGDLHDDIGSLLTATRLYLRQLDPSAGTERITAIKEQSLTIVDEMIQSTRRISHALLPPALEKFGLQAAAEDLCEWVDQSGALIVNCAVLTQERVTPDRELALYRVLQELINNTLRHAEAQTAEVAISRRRKHFTLTYRDDGRGFDPQQVQSGGLGLRNIESRVALVGGTLETRTAPGEGLRVRVELPITPPE